MRRSEKKKEGEEEEICGGKRNGDVMCSSSRRTMWLQCTDFICKRQVGAVILTHVISTILITGATQV